MIFTIRIGPQQAQYLSEDICMKNFKCAYDELQNNSTIMLEPIVINGHLTFFYLSTIQQMSLAM